MIDIENLRKISEKKYHERLTREKIEENERRKHEADKREQWIKMKTQMHVEKIEKTIESFANDGYFGYSCERMYEKNCQFDNWYISVLENIKEHFENLGFSVELTLKDVDEWGKKSEWCGIIINW